MASVYIVGDDDFQKCHDCGHVMHHGERFVEVGENQNPYCLDCAKVLGVPLDESEDEDDDELDPEGLQAICDRCEEPNWSCACGETDEDGEIRKLQEDDHDARHPADPDDDDADGDNFDDICGHCGQSDGCTCDEEAEDFEGERCMNCQEYAEQCECSTEPDFPMSIEYDDEDPAEPIDYDKDDKDDEDAEDRGFEPFDFDPA